MTAVASIANTLDIGGLAAPIENWIANAQGVAGAGIQQWLAHTGNQLLGQRGRLQFSKFVSWTNAYQTNTTGDAILWQFACHTGPATTTMRFAYCGTVATGTRAAAAGAFAYWVANTGLAGGGSTTTGAKLYMTAAGSSATVPNTWWYATQDFSVTPDTDYTFTLHVSNAAAVFSASAWEATRPILTPGVDTMIDGSAIVMGMPITSTQANNIISTVDKIWSRCGHPIFEWTTDTAGGSITRTSATAANMFDQTLTGAPATNDPKYPLYVDYSGSLDSSNVPVIVIAHGAISVGSGTVAFRDQANNTLATLTVNSATPGWYSTTANLADASGATPTTAIYPYIAGDGTHALTLDVVGMFMKV